MNGGASCFVAHGYRYEGDNFCEATCGTCIDYCSWYLVTPESLDRCGVYATWSGGSGRVYLARGGRGVGQSDAVGPNRGIPF